MNSKELQFNGAILLYGYLQRLFVYGKIKGMLGSAPSVLNMGDLPSLLDKTGAVFQKFDRVSGLTKSQQEELLDTLDTVESLVPPTLTAEAEPQLADKLAVAGGALYAEEYINNGIIHLGDIFNEQIADRFRQHIPHFRNRVNAVNLLVDKAAKNHNLDASETAQLESWYKDIIEHSANIEADFKTIRQYITQTVD